MRHRQKRFQLNRFTSWRKSTLISLARSILIYQSIRTTSVKAKAVRPLVDKLISLAKKNTLQAKRQAYQILSDHKLVSLLFKDIAGRFANRGSGYTRMINLASRRGDNARMAILELTEIKKKEPKPVKKEKEPKPEIAQEKPAEGKKAKTEVAIKERPQDAKKPPRKFLGGIKNIFKKERDSL